MSHFVKLVLCVFVLPFLSFTASAQDTSGKTILVLDASGSMWGQIKGVSKIEIARDVITDLLKEIPDDQELGLSAYGHNRKGDCSDIETLVAPALGTKDAIINAISAIKPKGKTPLSEAVIRAAETLKYTEDKATVILISDGKETCKFDPCEVGKQLEESGVDFTAHVVGFNVASPVDRAQLQCLAENTGGKFFAASNADELSKALKEVSAPPAPTPKKVIFRAIETETESPIEHDLVWTLTNTDTGEVVVEPEGMPLIETSLLPGNYKASVMRITDGATGELDVGIFKNTNTQYNVELPPYLPAATLKAADQAPMGSTVAVDWTGPNDENDYITVAEIGSKPTSYIRYAYTQSGTPVELLMPAAPGNYELRYVLNEGGKVLATRPITTTPVTANLDAADTANAGDELLVTWDGPDYNNDYISVAKIDANGNRYEKYTYTASGSPLQLKMPVEPGQYELRYVMAQDSTVIATRPVNVTNIHATLNAPETAKVGESIVVEWTGPDYKSDYIDVASPTPVATAQTRYINYSYTESGSPTRLQMPTEPGDYVIRYVLAQGSTILVERPIKVEAISISLTIPKTAKVGEPLLVEWSGPNYKNDYISVAAPGTKGSKYAYYTYTKKGSPLRLKMPLEPGEYEVRYIVSQDNTIKAAEPITIEPLDVSFDFSETAKIGEPLLINWQGPDYKGDYIAVAKADESVGRYINYTYTTKGTPLRLEMPAEPGLYEVRYMANGSPDKILSRKPVTVEGIEASVKLVETATSGEPALIEWTGPDYKGDYIGVSELGTKNYQTYAYTRAGSPLKITMPSKPGTYELRYFLKQDNTIIAREQIQVK